MQNILSGLYNMNLEFALKIIMSSVLVCSYSQWKGESYVVIFYCRECSLKDHLGQQDQQYVNDL